MSKFFEGAPQQAEVMKGGFWSKGEVDLMREFARTALEKIKGSPANLTFESALEKAFPSLNSDERHQRGEDLHEYILALAQKEDPTLTGKISVEELKHFIEVYLAE